MKYTSKRLHGDTLIYRGTQRLISVRYENTERIVSELNQQAETMREQAQAIERLQAENARLLKLVHDSQAYEVMMLDGSDHAGVPVECSRCNDTKSIDVPFTYAQSESYSMVCPDCNTEATQAVDATAEDDEPCSVCNGTGLLSCGVHPGYSWSERCYACFDQEKEAARQAEIMQLTNTEATQADSTAEAVE